MSHLLTDFVRLVNLNRQYQAGWNTNQNQMKNIHALFTTFSFYSSFEDTY